MGHRGLWSDGQGCGSNDYGFCFWVVGRGLMVVGRGLMVHWLWVMARWSNGWRLWSDGYGLWVRQSDGRGFGSWATVWCF